MRVKRYSGQATQAAAQESQSVFDSNYCRHLPGPLVNLPVHLSLPYKGNALNSTTMLFLSVCPEGAIYLLS